MTTETTASVAEMMAELDAIAAQKGIKWGAGEEASTDTSERTRYAKPGQKCGRGRVRLLSPKQVNFIKRLMAERDTRNLLRLPGSEDIEFMSLRGASDLIDRLLGCPELPAGRDARQLSPRPTDAQVNFALSLSVRKLGLIEGSEEFKQAKKAFEATTKNLIGKKIDELKALRDAPAQQAKAPSSAPEFPEVPEGRYAIEIDGTVKFYQVDRPTEGRWEGYVFLKVQASDDTYPIKNVTTKRAILAEIAKDSYAALLRYGQEIGRCGHCGRTLTDEASRARGIGPICKDKF